MWEGNFILQLFIWTYGSRSKWFQGDLDMMISVQFHLKIIYYFATIRLKAFIYG